ncbi:MAG: hypothetical protein ACXIU8_13135 [Alkalilacustris sp.]
MSGTPTLSADADPLISLIRSSLCLGHEEDLAEMTLTPDQAAHLAILIEASGEPAYRPICDRLRFGLIVGGPLRLRIGHVVAEPFIAALERGAAADAGTEERQPSPRPTLHRRP